MIYILIGALLFGGIVYIYASQNKKTINSQPEIIITEKTEVEENLNSTKNDSLSYPERLNKTKKIYPFKYWRESFFEYDMEQYTQENCDAAKKVFDDLINELIKLRENAPEKKKVQLFEKAIKQLNKLSDKEEALIETGEREDLCELIDQITIASGLNPKDYADGEGIADLWREW
jgi:hypothetical protein